MNVFIMSLGEIEKVGAFLELTPHINGDDALLEIDTLLLLGVFLFLMPIVLMNLLVRQVTSPRTCSPNLCIILCCL